MPPKEKKPKKPKVKKDKSVKAIAKTKKGSAQAQTTNVIVKVGEVKKPPARRRRSPAKPKGGIPKPPPPPPDAPFTDGWYPPQNLGRNGASFGSEQIRYVNVPTPAQTNLLAGPAVAPPSFVPQAQAPLALEGGFDTAFTPDFDETINQAIVSAERTVAGIPETPAPAPTRRLKKIAPPPVPTLKQAGEEDWTDMASFIRPSVSGRQFVEARKEEPTFASPVAQEITFASQFPQPEFPESAESSDFEIPNFEVPAIMPSSVPVPSFLNSKTGRKAQINWYFDNMKTEGQSVLPQAIRSKIIRQALKNVSSAKLQDKRVGIDKLNEQESNAVISILKRINAGETILFDV